MTNTVVQGGDIALGRHPAVVAWRKVSGSLTLPSELTVLKPEHRKSSVYRLAAVGPGGGNIVAKRGAASRLAIERTVYSEILPHIELSKPAFYGGIADENEEFGWIFLEDVGDERYAQDQVEHAVLAARWLARMHVLAAPLADTAALPERGLAHYRDVLWKAQATLEEAFSNPAFSDGDLDCVKRLLLHCRSLETHWDFVEQLVSRVPRTLTHGGFNDKNLRIRTVGGRKEFIPLDWEAAGWGIPLGEIARVDATAYFMEVRSAWKSVDVSTIQQATNLGTIFWALAPIEGELPSFRASWVGKLMGKLRYYEAAIDSAMKNIGWKI